MHAVLKMFLVAVVCTFLMPFNVFAGCKSIEQIPRVPVYKDKMKRKKSDNVTIVNPTAEDVIVKWSLNSKSNGWVRVWGYADGVVVTANSKKSVYLYGIGNRIHAEAMNGCGEIVDKTDIDVPRSTTTWTIGS